MRPEIRLAIGLFAALAPVWLGPSAAQSPAARSAGKVLVLDNERTLEGEIERVGEQYRIRRPVGELWVPADTTLRLCETREEAYAFLRARANLLDPDEHLRLARWCHLQGLIRQALEEAAAAVELRPNHAESRRLLRTLQQRSGDDSRPSQPAKTSEEGPSNAPPPELSTEALSLFVTRVQPIVMNACASCHASGRGGAFKLMRIYERGTITQKTTQQNLAAVVAQLNRERPAVSPLLTKAVSIHGKPGEMTQSPLKNREVAAYRSLEDWVRLTLDSNPQRSEAVTARTAPAEAGPITEAAARRASPAEKASETKTSSPATAGATDPFDPALFNRQMHPQAPGKGNSQNPGAR